MKADPSLPAIILEASPVKFIRLRPELQETMPALRFWEEFAKYSTRPDSSIHKSVEQAGLSTWLNEQLREMDTGDIFLMSVGGYGSLPWCEFHSALGLDGLVAFWLSLETHEILFFFEKSGDLVGVLDEEYE